MRKCLSKQFNIRHDNVRSYDSTLPEEGFRFVLGDSWVTQSIYGYYSRLSPSENISFLCINVVTGKPKRR